MFCRVLMSETMSFDRLRSSIWTDLQGPANNNMSLIILCSFNNVGQTTINIHNFINPTSMEANVGSPSFHSWQSRDKIDKHLDSCVFLSYLVDFIYWWVPENGQWHSKWKNDTKTPQKRNFGPTLQMQWDWHFESLHQNHIEWWGSCCMVQSCCFHFQRWESSCYKEWT